MDIIKDSEGNTCKVSKELYRLRVDKSNVFGDNYRKGCEVRLISNSYNILYNEPGYHFSKSYKTITSAKARIADFYGVKTDELTTDCDIQQKLLDKKDLRITPEIVKGRTMYRLRESPDSVGVWISAGDVIDFVYS